MSEKGELQTIGMNRGKPITYGIASLSAPDEVSQGEDVYGILEWIVERLTPHIETIKNSADDIYLDLAVYYRGQCNMAFEPELLKKLADLNIPFWVSCYEDDVEDNK